MFTYKLARVLTAQQKLVLYRFPLKEMIIVGFIHQMNGATKVKQMQKLTKSEAKSHSV